MKKFLLSVACCMAAAAGFSAEVHEGNFYVLGLNGNSTPGVDNKLTLLERTEDDIDEGMWRWEIPVVNITEETGTLTVGNGADFKLGFQEDNIFGMTNDLTARQSMLYLAQDGPAINYTLKEGEYKVMLACFEDLEGDMGGDTWMLSVTSLTQGEADECYYLIGFNGNEGPSSVMRFIKEETEEEGETYVMYSLPRTFISSCEEGFSLMDASTEEIYGLNPDFASMGSEVTDQMPMAFLAPGGEKVKCSLTEGYYDINFTGGAMAMITFIRCEDQTPSNELDYYLVGLNGITGSTDANKFVRTVEKGEYEDEDSGEMISYENILYTLSGVEFKNAPEGLTVVAENGLATYGFDTAITFLPNDITEEMPMAIMVVNGDPVNCSLPEGTYDFVFTFTAEGQAILSATNTDDNAVEIVTAEDSEAIYYNLNGIRVAHPENGIYIVRKGGKISKRVIK